MITALARAQAAFGDIRKDQEAVIPTKNGGEYTYRYASLAAIVAATRKALAENGLAVTHQILPQPGGRGLVQLVTTLWHESGESQTTAIEFTLDQDPKAMGSRLTYYRRYQIQNLLNIAPDDDDDGTRAAEEARRAAEAARKHNVHSQGRRPSQSSGPAPQRENTSPRRDQKRPESGTKGPAGAQAQTQPAAAAEPNDPQITPQDLADFYAFAKARGFASKEAVQSWVDVNAAKIFPAGTALGPLIRMQVSQLQAVYDFMAKNRPAAAPAQPEEEPENAGKSEFDQYSGVM